MPASRKARAITLAPRSCPSRPGFATSTRIFNSAIAIHLTTEPAVKPSGNSTHPIQSKRFCIDALPQVPARHATVRFPALCNLFHLLRRRKLDFRLAALLDLWKLLSGGRPLRRFGPLYFEIVLVYRHAHAKIARR